MGSIITLKSGNEYVTTESAAEIIAKLVLMKPNEQLVELEVDSIPTGQKFFIAKDQIAVVHPRRR